MTGRRPTMRTYTVSWYNTTKTGLSWFRSPHHHGAMWFLQLQDGRRTLLMGDWAVAGPGRWASFVLIPSYGPSWSQTRPFHAALRSKITSALLVAVPFQILQQRSKTLNAKDETSESLSQTVRNSEWLFWSGFTLDSVWVWKHARAETMVSSETKKKIIKRKYSISSKY